MAKKTTKKTPNYEKYVDESKARLLEALDEEITQVEAKLRKYEPLIEHKKSLESSKRSLLGGARLTSGNNGMRMRQEDIVAFLEDNPGSTGKEIADNFGAPYSTISSHLYRGRNERFLEKDKRWFNRDPEAGVNTVDDLPDDE
jgi:Fic family protein